MALRLNPCESTIAATLGLFLLTACGTNQAAAVTPTANVHPTGTPEATSTPLEPTETRGDSSARKELATVIVRAGDHDRDHTLASFDYAEGAGQSFALRSADGAELPVQVDSDGTATFVLPHLPRGAQASYKLLSATGNPAATAREVDSVIRLAVDGRTVVDFQLASTPPEGVDSLYARGGYLHPLYTPSGVAVTDDYPEDHRHHHGIWSAWTRAEFDGVAIDFWNVHRSHGRVDLDGVRSTWQGPVHAGLDAMLVHQDVKSATTALNERWIVRVYKTHDGAAPYFTVDLESTQSAATESPLELLEYHYGGFALRGHSAWRDPNNVVFLTSEGHDRKNGENTKGRWCFIGGKVDGKAVGFAGLGHPSNFRAPQKMRIHPSDPYMAFAPVKEGPFSIEPGTPYVTRFRFISLDGPPDRALLDRLWNDYATPPRVTVTKS